MTVKQHFVIVGLEFESHVLKERDVVLLKLLPTEVEISSGYYISGPEEPLTEPRKTMSSPIGEEMQYHRIPSNVFEKLGKPTIGDTITFNLQVSSPSASSSVISVGDL